jgi:hypothetical protein
MDHVTQTTAAAWITSFVTVGRISNQAAAQVQRADSLLILGYEHFLNDLSQAVFDSSELHDPASLEASFFSCLEENEEYT